MESLGTRTITAVNLLPYIHFLIKITFFGKFCGLTLCEILVGKKLFQTREHMMLFCHYDLTNFLQKPSNLAIEVILLTCFQGVPNSSFA
jgi:hypothetical protein